MSETDPNQQQDVVERTWGVYIVECADGTLYTGCARGVAARIHTHNSGQGAKYTRSRLPVRLVYSENCQNRSEASQREAQIKKLSRKQKKLLIQQKNKNTLIR